MHDIFFFTDIHGMYDLYRAIMDYCNEQDPEATIIFGGDACDRGTDGYKIIKELLDNPRVVYLKGNHEDMFVSAALELKTKFEFVDMDREEIQDTLKHCLYIGDKFIHINHVLHNGGINTLTDWILDGMPLDIVKRINELPLTFNYGECDFCHSAGIYRTFKEVADAEYEGKKPDECAAEALIWGRTGLNTGWMKDRIAVFGHTPTIYLDEFTGFKFPEDEEATPVMYKRGMDTGWKLDMDTGVAFTKNAYVLNVLTMKAQGFKLKDNKIEKIEVIKF